MIRNLKTLGLALVAVFALSAVAASAASAGQLTSDGPVYLTGTDNATGNALTYPGLPKVTCEDVSYVGEEVGNANPLPESGATETTVTPDYEEVPCTAEGLPTTVKMHGCHYVLTLGSEVGTDEYAVTSDLVCPEGQEVVVHIYANAAHSINVCTVRLKASENQNLTGAKVKTNTASDDLDLVGSVEGVHASKEKAGCGGAGSTPEAKLDVNVTITGENEGGTATGVTVTG